MFITVPTSRALALAAGSLAALALAAAPPAAFAAPRTTITDCTGHEVVRPSSYTLTCGDANTALTRLRWSGWGSAYATATATEVLNLCVPDCVDGKVVRFAVDVVAQRPTLSTAAGPRRYQEIVVEAGADRPRGVRPIQRFVPISPGR